MINQNSMKGYYDAQIKRILAGTEHVITYIDYNKLPIGLKDRFEPLFRRFDTTYRLKAQYMKPRSDVDPNTVISHVVKPRMIYATKQELPRLVDQSNIINSVNSQVIRPNTELSKKTFGDVLLESKMLKKNPVSVTTKYSNY